jgi:hypothetical protein
MNAFEFVDMGGAGESHPPLQQTCSQPFRFRVVRVFGQYGRGSLLLLDSPQAGRTYKDRRARLELNCATVGIALFNELNRPLPDNCVRLTMSYRDDGALARVGDFCEAERLTNRGDWHGLWDILQECNRVLGCDFYEGLIAKRADSLYPLQLRSASEEYPYWMKHRWAF